MHDEHQKMTTINTFQNNMKTLRFAAIAALALAASCSHSIKEEQVNDANLVPVRISVNETKATYSNSLAAVWETGDKIAIIQDAANSAVAQLSNTEANKNVFTGSVSIPSSLAKTFYFAYPASALTRDGEDINCVFTIPATQNGKWIPYLFAQTENAILPSALSNLQIDFGSTLGAALAIRVYNNSKDQKKEIASIVVSAENNITGTITNGVNQATGGKTITLTGEAATTSGTVGDVAYTEYRFNVVPTTAGIVTITLNDGTKTVTATTTASVTFVRNKRTGLNILWPAGDQSTSVTATFDDAEDNGWTDLQAQENE